MSIGPRRAVHVGMRLPSRQIHRPKVMDNLVEISASHQSIVLQLQNRKIEERTTRSAFTAPSTVKVTNNNNVSADHIVCCFRKCVPFKSTQRAQKELKSFKQSEGN